MKFALFFFLILAIMGVSGGILPVSANDETNSTNETNATLPLPINADTNQSEDIPVGSIKAPMTGLIYADVSDSTKGAGNESETINSEGETTEREGTDNANNSTPTYASLGDIIKAKDWKALGEYNCKIKAENPEKFEDTGLGSGDQEGRWNSYFTSPRTILYAPCCG